MTEPIKSAYPVQTRIFAPLNAGSKFISGSYIQFRINASELPMWLVNDSYLKFTIKYTREAYTINACADAADTKANKQINKTYIRDAANLFNMVKVMYGGDELYTQTYNIENNTLNTLKDGDSYLVKNFNTYVTNQSIKEGLARLVFDNGEATSATAAGNVAETTGTITDVIVPVNRLMPMFMDLNSEGFPVGKLKRQLEINLYIAEPYKFLVDYDDEAGDFSAYFRRCSATSSDADAHVIKQAPCEVSIKSRYPAGSIEIVDPHLYCQCYVPTNEEDAVITSKINSTGIKYRYHIWHFGVRETDGIKRNNNLPFSVTTENTSAFLLYCHDQTLSPSLMRRPYINSLYLRFGEMQLPFQPIPGDTYTTPYEYKFTSEDVLDYIDAKSSESNSDYDRSYMYIDSPANEAATLTGNRKPGSSFILMGANFTNNPDKLGSPSSRWNHQYQASFNTSVETTNKLRFVLGVKTEYGFIIKNGDLAKINI